MKKMAKLRMAAVSIKVATALISIVLAILICNCKPNGCACESDEIELIASARGMSLNLPRIYGQATRPQTQQCCCGCKALGGISHHDGGGQQHGVAGRATGALFQAPSSIPSSVMCQPSGPCIGTILQPLEAAWCDRFDPHPLV